MSAQKNYHFYGSDADVARLAEEYVQYLGRQVEIEPGHLTVLALPRKKVVKKNSERDNRRQDRDAKEQPKRETDRNKETVRARRS